MKPSTAFIITEMLDLTNKEAAGNASRAYIAGMGPQSGKTGTSNWAVNDYGIPDGSQKDKWLVNYTPDITTVTWTGYTNEYYSQGYYIPYGTRYEGYVMQDMLEDVPYYDDEYLHDDSFEQPSNVASVPLNPNVDPNKPYPNYWPYTKMEGGEEHWFIVGSEDYNQIQEDYSATKAPKPNVVTSQTDKAMTLTWDYTGSNRNTAKWNIYIDGKLYKTTDQTSISITTADLALVAGCKNNYTVEVELVESNDKNQTRVSERASINIALPNTDFCKPKEPTPPNPTSPTPNPTTPVTPAPTTPPTPSNMFIGNIFRTSLLLIK
jgi:membrane peptidoglycan carboxypeptidase